MLAAVQDVSILLSHHWETVTVWLKASTHTVVAQFYYTPIGGFSLAEVLRPRPVFDLQYVNPLCFCNKLSTTVR